MFKFFGKFGGGITKAYKSKVESQELQNNGSGAATTKGRELGTHDSTEAKLPELMVLMELLWRDGHTPAPPANNSPTLRRVRSSALRFFLTSYLRLRNN